MKGHWQFCGWAADVQRSQKVDQVIVFLNGKSIYSGKTLNERGDVSEYFNNSDLTEIGYTLEFSLNKNEENKANSLRFFAVSAAGVASELSYCQKYHWSR